MDGGVSVSRRETDLHLNLHACEEKSQECPQPSPLSSALPLNQLFFLSCSHFLFLARHHCPRPPFRSIHLHSTSSLCYLHYLSKKLQILLPSRSPLQNAPSYVLINQWIFIRTHARILNLNAPFFYYLFEYTQRAATCPLVRCLCLFVTRIKWRFWHFWSRRYPFIKLSGLAFHALHFQTIH